MRQRIGFLGLGQMGAAIAERLLDDAIELHVHDPASARLTDFVGRGAQSHPDARSVADACRVVIACLPDPPTSVASAALVANGTQVRHYVEMSTIGRPAMEAVAAVLAQSGIKLIDAPVSGGPAAARAGSLVVIAAGAPDALAQADPVLRRIAGTILTVGSAPGAAQAAKLVNNLLAAVNLAAASEAVALAARHGVDPTTAIAVMNACSGRNSATEWLIPRHVLTGTFDFGATIATIRKDIALALGVDDPESRCADLPVSAAAKAAWRSAASRFGDDADISTMATPASYSDH